MFDVSTYVRIEVFWDVVSYRLVTSHFFRGTVLLQNISKCLPVDMA